MTAAVRTGSADGVFDPVVELMWQRGVVAMDEVQEELPVSLRAGQARVYDAQELSRPCEGGLGHVAENAPVHIRVADHAAPPDLLAAGLELRLDENERLPPRLREPERRRKRGANADERDVAGHEIGGKRELGELAGIRALEHGHARVVAQPLVKLAAPDVERDHARRAALEQDVGEAAGRGTDVERVAPG